MPRHISSSARPFAFINRRDFLRSAGLAAAGTALTGGQVFAQQARKLSANDKLNLAVIGVAGRGGENLREVAASENIVALCDVDSTRLAAAAPRFPDAKTYSDFRRLID